MIEYHKIQTIFKRNEKTKKIIINDWTLSEFEYLKDNIWQFSEKIDGTNIRIDWDCLTSKITLGGRTENAQISANLISRLNEIFNIELLKSIFPAISVLFFGEGYGAKIQKGGGNYKSDGVDFILFDVLIKGMWLERNNVNDIADKLGIKSVPIIGDGTLQNAIDIVSSGFNSSFGNFLAEGFVMRPKTELFTRNGKRIIAKIKTVDFK
jgi:hypothetical protein